MSAFIALIALAGLFVGLVSIVFPLRFLRINNRGIAMLLVVGSVLVLQSAAGNLPNTPAVEPPKQVSQIIKPTISDGCDLAGAIPNCKEEVARLAAVEAAHPLPPRPATTAPREKPSRFISEVLAARQADENSAKAAEARAG